MVLLQSATPGSRRYAKAAVVCVAFSREVMKYEEARQRLAGHANLPGTDLPIEGSFVGGLWLFDKNKAELAFEPHSEDIVSCLRAVNTHFNGADPDTRSGPADHSRIAEVAYPISGIVAGGTQYHLKWTRNKTIGADLLELLGLSLFKIAYAWDQVLAGDVTDILEGFDLVLGEQEY